MKLSTTLSFVCSLIFLLGNACSADTDYRVKWVADGDTIVLTEGSKVRYIGINAPELPREDHIGEPYANEAKRFNARLVKNKTVRLEFDIEPNDRFQ
ncbi:MAG: thermonuclease family protein, partial [Desulfobacterales bacterium]